MDLPIFEGLKWPRLGPKMDPFGAQKKRPEAARKGGTLPITSVTRSNLGSGEDTCLMRDGSMQWPSLDTVCDLLRTGASTQSSRILASLN